MDIDSTHDQITGLASPDASSLGALSTLADACAAIWHDSVNSQAPKKQLFLFRERMSEWVKGRYMLIAYFKHVLIHDSKFLKT